MTDAAQRCRILLEQLYHLSQRSRLDEHVLFPEQVSTILRVDLDDTIDIVNFLEELGYIKCGRSFGRPYSWVKVTSKGMELFVNPSEIDQTLQELTSGVTMPEMTGSEDAENPFGEDATVPQSTGQTGTPTDSLPATKESLYHVVESLAQKDDQPLRELLATLILEGGLESTLAGVKALLAISKVKT